MECTETSIVCWKHYADLRNRRYCHTFDLQLFNEEKTEEATPKRRQDAREKGQVAKSVELNSAFIILASFLSLKILGSVMYEEVAAFLRLTYSTLARSDLTVLEAHRIIISMAIVVIKVALPIMLVIVLISVLVNILQVGVSFTTKPLMPSLDKINPITGFGRLFSKRVLVDLIKSILKIVIIGYFIYRFISKELVNFPGFINQDLTISLTKTVQVILEMAFQIGAVILVMAVLDYFYQWWEHNQNIKMSKKELKEEYKQAEGDPKLKGKIKERQRAMAMQRMMQEVPTASVVVVNPTHFAVALKYEKEMPAPIVVAKGQDFLAQRIKDMAKENNVAIVENKPLARSLYSLADIGSAVPPELYQAVAEVLAYVYRLNKKLS